MKIIRMVQQSKATAIKQKEDDPHYGDYKNYGKTIE